MNMKRSFKAIALVIGVSILSALMISPTNGDVHPKFFFPINSSISWEKTPDQGGIFSWEYGYNAEPAVLTGNTDAPWRQSSRIYFEVRSDREGALVLRFNQTNGKVFYSVFTPTQEWQAISFYPKDMIPFDSASNEPMDVSLLEHIFIADMNGPDHGKSGDRTVWMKNFSLKETIQTDPDVVPEIPLLAYGPGGRLLTEQDFKAMGVSAGQWFFATDSKHSPVKVTVKTGTIKLDGEPASVPVLIPSSTSPLTLEILFWQAGESYKLWLRADGRGKGIQNSLINGSILLNLELAHTRLNELLSSDYTKDKALSAQLNRMKIQLEGLDPLESTKECAQKADLILKQLLDISQKSVAAQSRERVMKRLTPKNRVILPFSMKSDLNNQPWVQLVEPDFRIGVVQSFGFEDPQETNSIPEYYAKLRETGFNHFVLPLFWDKIVDEKNKFTHWEDILQIPELVSLGYTLHTHAVIQAAKPKFIEKQRGEEFRLSAEQHLAKVFKTYQQDYGSSMHLWEIVNEPSSNIYGGYRVKDRVRLVEALIAAHRNMAPDAKVMVNDYDWQRGIDAQVPWEKKRITGTLLFYQALLKTANPPDVLGLEWYPGLSVNQPAYGIQLFEPCKDLLDTGIAWDQLLSLGLPVMISEFSVPDRMAPSGKNGYAWGKWDMEVQARAAVDSFFLALSKPGITGWVWWGITDKEPWNTGGGLFDSQGLPKPVLEHLGKAISSLKKPLKTTINISNQISMPSVPGIYRIFFSNTPESGRLVRLSKTASGEFTLALENQISF